MLENISQMLHVHYTIWEAPYHKHLTHIYIPPKHSTHIWLKVEFPLLFRPCIGDKNHTEISRLQSGRNATPVMTSACPDAWAISSPLEKSYTLIHLSECEHTTYIPLGSMRTCPSNLCLRKTECKCCQICFKVVSLQMHIFRFCKIQVNKGNTLRGSPTSPSGLK